MPYPTSQASTAQPEKRIQKKAIALLTRIGRGVSGVIGSIRIPGKSPANPR